MQAVRSSYLPSCTGLIATPTSIFGRLHPFTGHEGPQGEQRYCSTLFQTFALEGPEGSGSRPGRTLPPGKTRYPLYRRLSGPQGRSGQVRKISPHRDSIPGPSSPQAVAIPTEYPACGLRYLPQNKQILVYCHIDRSVHDKRHQYQLVCTYFYLLKRNALIIE